MSAHEVGPVDLVIANARLIATVDEGRNEVAGGWISIRAGFIESLGMGEPPPSRDTLDASGCLVTPGLVNTHHHLYQNLTRSFGPMTEATLWVAADALPSLAFH